VIAALGATLIDGGSLEAVAACYVLILAIAGPVLARFADQIPIPARLATPQRPPVPADVT
jgi:hypothetical protein